MRNRLSLSSLLVATLVYPRHVVDDDTAGVAPDEALTPAQAADEHVDATVTVPAKHATLIERAAALLREAESDITDNVEAGIAYLEQLWKDRNAAN